MSETGTSYPAPDYRKVIIRRDDPTRYDWSSSAVHERADAINYPEVRINAASEYTASLIEQLLPFIIKSRRPKSLEFIDHPNWKQSNGETRRLRGAIIRDTSGDVLLYAYGFGLDSMTGDLAQIFFDAFAISPEDQLRAKNITWPSLTYSVIVDLDLEE